MCIEREIYMYADHRVVALDHGARRGEPLAVVVREHTAEDLGATKTVDKIIK